MRIGQKTLHDDYDVVTFLANTQEEISPKKFCQGAIHLYVILAPHLTKVVVGGRCGYGLAVVIIVVWEARLYSYV